MVGIAEVLRSPRRHRTILGKYWRKRNVLDVDGRPEETLMMTGGNEFQRSDAATGNERRATVVSRNGGTSS